MTKKCLLVSALLLVFGVAQVPVNPLPFNQVVQAASTNSVKKQIQITAIGDSLTQGVGDGAHNQGYVGLIKSKIDDKYPTNVTTANFGVGGNTSAQILERVQKDPKLQTSAKGADAIVLTMGGNDIMDVIKHDPLHVTQSSVKAQSQKTSANLAEILTNLRTMNPTAPIFVIGLYNPFYVLLPTVTTMQTVVSKWNQNTANTVAKAANSYFVPVDKLLTKGDKKTQAQVAARLKAASKHDTVSAKEKDLMNPYLYKKDHFHPNHAGYVQMTNALYNVMNAHKQAWLYQ